jgi:filamentous hemagglutinin family protein
MACLIRRKTDLNFGVNTLGIIAFCLFPCFSSDIALSQVIPDDSLKPENSIVEPNIEIKGTPSELIRGGAVRGSSLFHSFERFNIQAGKGVYFTNPPNVDLILSRVTGNGNSQILGKLGVLGNADLFFFNPNGIIFGPGASLDLNGSFLASTASRIVFPEDSPFDSANPQASPLLMVSAPVGLQFGNNSGAILVSGASLEVPDSKTLAFLANGVTITGSILTSPSGRIEIGSVAQQDGVQLRPSTNGWSVSYQNTENFSDITLSQASELNAAGLNGGDVQVQGRNITIADGSAIGITVTEGSQATGGLLSITATNTLELIGSALVSATFSQEQGGGGDIHVSAQNLILRDGAFISSDSTGDVESGVFSNGDGGDIAIATSESVELFNSRISTGANGVGNAGDVTIKTNQLMMEESSIIQATTSKAGAAGNIMIDARQLAINSQSGILALAFGTGESGNISIQNADTVLLQGGSGLATDNGGQQTGGDISLEAEQLFLEDQAFISAAAANNQGGNIQLGIDKLLLLNRNSAISASAGASQFSGDGGNINIDTSLLVALENSDITANAFSGMGGNIKVTTQGLFLSPNSDITASSAFSRNGTVVINTPGTDPSDSTTTLSERISVPLKLAQSCRPGQALGNSQFSNVGRGGLPPAPTSTQTVPAVWDDIRPPTERLQTSTDLKHSDLLPVPETPPVVEAKGWRVTPRGMVLVGPESVPSVLAFKQASAC